MKILIDMLTKQVVGVNQEKKILMYEVEADSINPEKIISQPVTRQKTDDEGRPLYLKSYQYMGPGGVLENVNEEVTDSYTVVNKKAVYYPPILDTVNVDVRYTIYDNPSVFNLDDIIEAKSKQIISQSSFSNMILFEELQEKNLSVELASNLAHTGIKMISILPGGQIRTNKIQLPHSVERVEVYCEADENIVIEVGQNATNFSPLSNGIAIFSQPTNSFYIKFKNESLEGLQNIRSYGLLY